MGQTGKLFYCYIVRIRGVILGIRGEKEMRRRGHSAELHGSPPLHRWEGCGHEGLSGFAGADYAPKCSSLCHLVPG